MKLTVAALSAFVLLGLVSACARCPVPPVPPQANLDLPHSPRLVYSLPAGWQTTPSPVAGSEFAITRLSDGAVMLAMESNSSPTPRDEVVFSIEYALSHGCTSASEITETLDGSKAFATLNCDSGAMSVAATKVRYAVYAVYGFWDKPSAADELLFTSFVGSLRLDV